MHILGFFALFAGILVATATINNNAETNTAIDDPAFYGLVLNESDASGNDIGAANDIGSTNTAEEGYKASNTTDSYSKTATVTQGTTPQATQTWANATDTGGGQSAAHQPNALFGDTGQVHENGVWLRRRLS